MSQWALLVTEGHVRAARWRYAVPRLLALATMCVILGLMIAAILPNAERSSSIADAKAHYVASQHSAINTFMAEAGAIGEEGLANADGAASPEAAAANGAAALEALNSQGRLPDSVTPKKPAAFWGEAWTPGTVYAVQDARTILLGQIVNITPHYRRQPDLRRSFILLRRGADREWRAFCLAIPDAASCDREAIDPASIPATMRGLLPPNAFSEQASS